MNIGEFSEKVRTFSPVVVFIDDGFAAAKLDLIDSEDWALLRAENDLDATRWEELQNMHFPQVEKVMDLKRNPEELCRAWDLYMRMPETFKLLDPIFRKIAAEREVAIWRLRELMEFLEEEL